MLTVYLQRLLYDATKLPCKKCVMVHQKSFFLPRKVPYFQEVSNAYKHAFICIHSSICHRSGGNMDDNGPNDSNVKVAVRVRPMNRRGECSSGGQIM